MSAELFQNFGDGTNKRTDPTSAFVDANESGRVILDLGDRAKTINVDSNTDHILILNKLIDLGKPAFKNATEAEQIEAGFGIHTAATQDASRGSNAKKIDIFDNDDGTAISSELKKLIEIAQLGGAPGSDNDINLRLGSFGGDGDDAYFEILVDGKWSTDVIKLKGSVATLAIAELDPGPPANELSDGDENEAVSENQGTVELTNALDNAVGSDAGDPLIDNFGDIPPGIFLKGSNGGFIAIEEDGTVFFNDGGDFEALASGETAETSIEYTVTDGAGGRVTSTYTVTVKGENDAPIAVDDTAATQQESAITISVLSNDSDVEDDTLNITAVTDGENGTVVINEDGTVTYTPNASFTGSDSFIYTISDGELTDTATVDVTVKAVADPELLAVAYIDRTPDSNTYVDGVDELIAAIIDTNGDGALSAGDTITFGVFPLDINPNEDGEYDTSPFIGPDLEVFQVNTNNSQAIQVLFDNNGAVNFVDQPPTESFGLINNGKLIASIVEGPGDFIIVENTDIFGEPPIIDPVIRVDIRSGTDETGFIDVDIYIDDDGKLPTDPVDMVA